eukprot:3812964-Prymnesium_polylepis.1
MLAGRGRALVQGEGAVFQHPRACGLLWSGGGRLARAALARSADLLLARQSCASSALLWLTDHDRRSTF